MKEKSINKSEEINITNLEEYAFFLVCELKFLIDSQNSHVSVLKKGILPNDMIERTNTITWDIRRILNQYKDQLEAVLELLPSDFNLNNQIEQWNKKNIEKIKNEK